MVAVDLLEILETRGIALQAHEAYWTPFDYYGKAGWKYPLFNAQGQRWGAERWKNAISSGDPKYAWVPNKPDGIRYYLLPGTIEQIKVKNHFLYIASGEPDVLAYRAAGFYNVLSWFGENSIPATLADDLKRLGVIAAFYLPDRDTAGMKSAAKVAQLLEDSGIHFEARALPGELGTKNDVNWLWRECGFHRDRFQSIVMDLELIDPQDLYLYGQESSAQKPLFTPSIQTSDDAPPPAFLKAVANEIEKLPSWKKWESDGWGNFQCFFHDDLHKSAGFNCNNGQFNCFVCGGKPYKEVGAHFGITLSDYYTDQPVSVSAPVVHKPLQDLMTVPPAPPVQSVVEVPPLYMSSRDVAQQIIEELEGKRIPDTEPMSFPFEAFHQFGGFAELMEPGKLVYISGISGGGKTSFGEMCYRKPVMDGDGGVWFGPEWSPIEMGLRELQRSGGMNMTEFGKMRLWNGDGRRSVPVEHRRGFNPSDRLRAQSIQRMRDMAAWPGEMIYLNSDQRLNSVQAILDTVESIVTTRRATGQKMSLFFFDYLQRAPKNGARGWDHSELVVGQIKSLCERLKLFGFVFIQPTKGASRSARDGEGLNESSGQGISDQQANLYLAMTPGFNKLTSKREPYVKVRIVKNSMGRADEELYLETAMDRLTVLDKQVEVKSINLDKVAFGEDQAP